MSAQNVVTGCQLFDFRDEVGGELGGWLDAEIGDATGLYDWLTAGGVSIFVSSSDLYRGPDNAGFVHRTLTGYRDFRVEMPVPHQIDFSNGTYQKAGLMLRDGLDPLAARLMVMLVPGHPNGRSIQFDVRTAYGAEATELASTISAVGIDLLAIERRGATVHVEVSDDDGATWRQPLGALGGEASLAMTGDPQIGMALASDELAEDVGFVFPEMLVCGEDPVPPPPPIEVVDSCLNDPFDDSFVDVGWDLLALGDANQTAVTEAGGELFLTGDGTSLFSSPRDDGAFLHRAVAGDFRAEITVDVGTMGPAGPYRKGGLMLRTGLDDDAARFIAQLAPDWNDGGTTGLQFRYRAVDGGRGDITWGSNRFGVPSRLDLAIERRGDTILAFYSLDGRASWTQASGGANGAVTLPGLPETLFVGPNVVSYDASTAVTAAFDDFDLCAPGAVGGLVWWDQDGDAAVDDAEPGLEGVQVELRTATNQPIFTTYTGADGRYLFPVVEAGDYAVLIDSALPVGGVAALTYDLDGTQNQEIAYFTLDNGQQLLDADFGWRLAYPSVTCLDDDFDDGQISPDGPWFTVDFGDADQTSIDESAGVLSLSADGSSLYAGPDHGLYVFHGLERDFRVEVDVDGTATSGGPYAKGGLMVRPGFSSTGPRLLAQLVPDWNGTGESVLQFRYRSVEGGAGDGAWASNVFGIPSTVRLAIERTGDVFTVEYSLDGGATWQVPAGGAQARFAINWPDTILVGLDVVGYDTSTPATVVFDDYIACPVGEVP